MYFLVIFHLCVNNIVIFIIIWNMATGYKDIFDRSICRNHPFGALISLSDGRIFIIRAQNKFIIALFSYKNSSVDTQKMYERKKSDYLNGIK